MRPEIVSRESQPDNQPFVAKNTLLIAKDRVSELRVETGQCLGLFLVRLDQGDMDSVVGVARPCSRGDRSQLNSSSQSGSKRTKHLQSSSLDILATNLRRDQESKWVGEEVVESARLSLSFLLEKPKRRALDRVRDLMPGSRVVVLGNHSLPGESSTLLCCILWQVTVNGI